MVNADRKTVIWPRDSTIVAVNNPLEVEFWCGRLQATPAELAAAVRAVGNRFKDVRYYLRTHPHDNGVKADIDNEPRERNRLPN